MKKRHTKQPENIELAEKINIPDCFASFAMTQFKLYFELLVLKITAWHHSCCILRLTR